MAAEEFAQEIVHLKFIHYICHGYPILARPRWAIAAALIAIAFGIVTVIVGGKTLFGGAEVRAAAGNIVPFVCFGSILLPALPTLSRASDYSSGSVGQRSYH